MSKKSSYMTRRNFLKSSGGLAALPFLSSLAPRAFGQTTASPYPKRIVIITSGNGWHINGWLPGVNLWQPGVNASKVTSHSDGSRSMSFDDLVAAQSGVISPIFNTSLSAPELRRKMILIEGLDISATGDTSHQPRPTLSVKGDKSLDFILSDNDRFNPRLSSGQRTFQSVYLSAAPPPSDQGPFSNPIYFSEQTKYQDAGSFLADVSSPAKYYDPLFRNISTSQPTSPTPDPKIKRRDALNLARAEFAKLLNSTKISSLDKSKLQEHYEFLNSYEKTLGAETQLALPIASACEKPAYPSVDPQDHQTNVEKHLSFIAAAIKCNAGKVFCAQLMKDDSSAGDYIYSFLGVTRKLHLEISHNHQDQVNADSYRRIGKWQGEQIARFLKQLDVLEEDGRTYLDNTLVIWTNLMGATDDQHQYYNKPVAMWGATGYFNTGRFYSFGDARPIYRPTDPREAWRRIPVGDGIPQGHFFVEVLKAFGLTTADYGAGYGFEKSPNEFQKKSRSGKYYDLSDAAKARGLPVIRRG